MGLFDWKPTDYSNPAEAEYSPDPEKNGTGGCWRCGAPETSHCSDCSACNDDHAGWCPQEQATSGAKPWWE